VWNNSTRGSGNIPVGGGRRIFTLSYEN